MRKLWSRGRQILSKQLTPNLARRVVWGLLLVAFALRTYALGRPELTFDEVASFFIANRGPLDVLTYVRGAIREHPPLYYVLLSLWMPLTGTSEFAIRFLSIIIGVAAVAVIYRALQRITHRWLALLSALLLTLSPSHIGISRDARMYGLLALWTIVSAWAFVRLLEQERTSPTSTTQPKVWPKWGLFWLVTGLGTFTHYFMLFVLLAEDLYLVLRWRRYRRLLIPWLAIHAALSGIGAFWVVNSPGLRATLLSLWERGLASTVRWQALIRGLNGLYLGATARPNWYHLGLCLAVTALGLLPLRPREPAVSRKPGQDSLLYGLLLSVPIASVLALPERVSGRYLTPALPASIVAMARGLNGLFVFVKDHIPADKVRLRKLVAGLLPLALLGGVLFVDAQAYGSLYNLPDESYRDKIAYLRAYAQSDDGLLLHGPWQHLLLSYYDVGSLRTYTIPLRDLRVDGDRAETTLNKLFETYERLWVSYDSVDPVDPDWLVSRWLHEHTHQVLDHRDLALYYRPPVEDLATESLTRSTAFQTGDGYEHTTQPDIAFGEQLELEGVALSNVELVSGEAVLLLSRWRALRDIDPGLELRLELVGPGNKVWEDYQFKTKPADVAPQAWGKGDTFLERRGLVVPIGTPPGEYQLRLRVLSPAGEEWPPDGGEPFDVGLVRVQHHAPSSKALEALPGRELRADFGGTISLIGYAPWGHNFTQGNPVLFDVYWQALDTPIEDYALEIEVVQDRGSVLTERRVQPVADWCPTSSWRAQDVLKGHYVVPLPVDVPAGAYQIRLSLIAPDGSPLPLEGKRTHRVLDWWSREETLSGTDLVLFDGMIDPRPRQYQPPPMDYHVGVVLSNSEGQQSIRLLGYDLPSTPVEPGGSLELTLYWKALRRMERIYAVFNHLVGPDGTLWAQQDGWPQQGTYHTSQWLPGEIVEDRYTIQVPLDTPPGAYTLQVGMYDADTEERLLVLVDDQPVPERYVALTTITVAR